MFLNECPSALSSATPPAQSTYRQSVQFLIAITYRTILDGGVTHAYTTSTCITSLAVQSVYLNELHIVIRLAGNGITHEISYVHTYGMLVLVLAYIICKYRTVCTAAH